MQSGLFRANLLLPQVSSVQALKKLQLRVSTPAISQQRLPALKHSLALAQT